MWHHSTGFSWGFCPKYICNSSKTRREQPSWSGKNFHPGVSIYFRRKCRKLNFLRFLEKSQFFSRAFFILKWKEWKTSRQSAIFQRSCKFENLIFLYAFSDILKNSFIAWGPLLSGPVAAATAPCPGCALMEI